MASLGLYLYAFKSGKGEYEARSFAFVSLVLGNIFLILINLSWKKYAHRILMSGNRVLIFVITCAIISLLAVLDVPFLADLFHLSPLHLNDFIIIFLVLIASLAWFEIFKLINNRKIIDQPLELE